MASIKVPSSVLAEKALIGLILKYPSALNEATERGLQAKDFYDVKNRKIYQAVLELRNEHVIPDMMTTISRLQDKTEIDEVGGTTYITEAYDLADAETKAIQHINTILKKASLRDLLDATNDIQKRIDDQGYAEEDILNDARVTINRITETRGGSQFQTSKELAPLLIEKISALKTSKANEGIKTGLSRLDRNTNGFQKGELIILAARTSVGKTTFAVNLANYAAIHEHKNIAFFDLEMNADSILTRMIAVDGAIPLQKLKTGNLSSSDANMLMEAGNRITRAGINIDDSTMITVNDMVSKCKKLKVDLEARNETLDLIIVDYLQLITSYRNRDNRQTEVAEISRGLKELARICNCPVIALSQLSREITKRKKNENRTPQLSDLRESGAIEQDADIVMFLHNIKEDNNDPVRDIQLTIGKNRNGELMDMQLKFDSTCGIFTESTDQFEEFNE